MTKKHKNKATAIGAIRRLLAEAEATDGSVLGDVQTVVEGLSRLLRNEWMSADEELACLARITKAVLAGA